jgi:hypothetical protein
MPNNMAVCAERYLDPPDQDQPECPRCDRPLQIARRDRAECTPECGWVNEPDWSMVLEGRQVAEEHEQ